MLLKYFNCIPISTSFVLPEAEGVSFILPLNLNNSESVILSFRSSLWDCHKLSNVLA